MSKYNTILLQQLNESMKMKKYYKCFIIALFCSFYSINHAVSQDVNFTQFYVVPYQINPALTGSIDGTYRVGMVYKDQWRGGVDNPYTSTAVGGEVKFDIGRDKKQTDRAGLGLFFVNDQVNGIALNTSQISISGAYHKLISKDTKQYLGIGGQISIFQRNINYDQLVFGDEFNELDEFSETSAEVLPPNNLGFFDMSVGINYHIRPTKATAFFAGAAIHHITTPNISFYKNQNNPNPATDLNSQLNARIVGHFSYDQSIADRIILSPRVLFQVQGYDTEFRVGTNMKYFLEGYVNALHFGTYLSMINNVDGFSANMLSPLVGFQLKNFLIGVSYDVNLRQTFGGTRGLNSFEVSFRFHGEYYNENAGTICPEF